MNQNNNVTLRKLTILFKYRILNPLLNRLFFLYRPYIWWMSRRIRKKDKIKVLFILAELGSWKTERLYCKMKEHPRFEPILGVTTSIEVPGSKAPLIEYLQHKGYEFVDLDESRNSIGEISPDVKFYYKPYEESFPVQHRFLRHLKSLTCHIHYAFNQGSEKWAYNHLITKFCWFNFVENSSVVRTRSKIKGLYNGNVIATGFPMQDDLNEEPDVYPDPWTKDDLHRKRIIYAPHHSLPGTNKGGVQYSTFLDYGDFILEVAKKYKDKIQWAFKPHPTLYPKLLKIWGQQKTDDYYNAWKDISFSQVELGEYKGLFKHSDAMIHDCSSFIVEYHYSHRPVLYLLRDEKHCDEQNEFGIAAFNAHYKACSKSDIEKFIEMVLAGEDSMQGTRDSFFNTYLIPPGNKSACDNIIDVLLGKDSFGTEGK